MTLQSPEFDINKPIPVGLPIPNRKIIRSWLIPIAERKTLIAIVLQLVDTGLFLAGVVATVFFESLVLKTFFALFTGFVIGRIFIL